MWIFLSSVTAGLFAAMATFFLVRAHAAHAAHRKRIPHPVVRITIHHHMPERFPSDLGLDEDDAALCGCPRCALCPSEEDDHDYSFAQINRLHFARWMVERGRLSEF